MKRFKEHPPIPKIYQVNEDGGRHYLTEDGCKYPSVTTVVGLHNAAAIQKWRNRVGIEEASKITRRASTRGSAFHGLCENYLKTGKAEPSIFDKDLFDSMGSFLRRVNDIYCIEQQLYSHHLKVAGTVDLIAHYDGDLCVIDFKTSLRPKKFEYLHGYFMQMSAYAVMFEELTGINVPWLIVAIAIDDSEPQIMIQRRNDWIFKFRDLREQFEQLKGF